MRPPFHGKFRGVVTDVEDPLLVGRIRARVPAVTGEAQTGWALPCIPFPGFFAVPRVGANVWIEFEDGDPEYPIWTGCFWHGPSEAPCADIDRVMIGDSGHQLAIDAAGITLETRDGQRVRLAADGIEIDNGRGATVKLVGDHVSVNDRTLP